MLWQRYTSIRIDPSMRITNRDLGNGQSKTVFIIISAEAGLSGDIDQRLIEMMLQEYDPDSSDIIVLGSHGASQLTQRGIKYKRYFQVPETDSYIDVNPVIEAIQDYSRNVIYYEEYVSLATQEIRTIDMISSLKEMSENSKEGMMTADDTIFEPSLDVIAEEMESTMMTLVLSQTIMESSLAQAASRFNAMTLANKRASDMLSSYLMELYRAKRYETDRRMHEVLISLKEKRRRAGAHQ